MSGCAVEECRLPIRAREMCSSHYQKWARRTPRADRKPASTPGPEQRFWAKVSKGEGCWIWTGGTASSGHGKFAVSQARRIGAHSYSLELALGYPAPPGTECCHRCDNPPCVNPAHLYFGTRLQNVRDAWERGRVQVGEDRPSAKLREVQVVQLREEYARGSDVDELAAAYGIAVSTIRGIVLGIKWKHAGGPLTRRRPERRKAQVS